MSLASAEVVTVAGESVIVSSHLDISERKRAEEALRLQPVDLAALQALLSAAGADSAR